MKKNNKFLNNFRVGKMVLASITTFAIVMGTFPVSPAFAANTHQGSFSNSSQVNLGNSVEVFEEVLKPVKNNQGPNIVASMQGISTALYPSLKLPGSISGKVVNDINGNHQLDASEPGLMSWTIELYDTNSSEETPTPVAVAVTNETGGYTFDAVTSGTYLIKQVLKNNRWEQTFPSGEIQEFPEELVTFIPDSEFQSETTLNATAAPTITSEELIPPTAEYYTVTITGYQNITEKNFGNFKLATASGYLFNDLNADGIWQKNGSYPELGIESWEMEASQSGTTNAVFTGLGGSYLFDFNSSAMGNWNISASDRINWRHTSPVNPIPQSITVNSSGNLFEDITFGIVRFYDILGMKLVPFSGEKNSTHETLVLDSIAISFPMNGGTALIGVESETLISQINGKRFDLNEFVAEETNSTTIAGIDSGSTIDGVIKWGVPDHELGFDKAVSISAYVGTALDGQSLTIQRSTTGISDWTTDGIEDPTTCTVLNGSCTFSTTKASYYALTHVGGNNGGGGSGGSGGGNIPIPPSTGGENNSDGSNSEEPLFEGIGGVPGFNAPVTLLPEIGSIAQLESEIELQIGGSAELESTTFNESDELEITNGTSDNNAFLGAFGNILTLGTDNAFIGWIVLLLVLLIIFLIARRSRKDKSVQ